MKESKCFKSLMATLVAITLGGPTVVLACTAAQFDGVAHTHVTYSDLNLESADGVQELYKRLQDASRKACGVTSPMSAGTMAWRACNRDTLSDTVDKFENEDLSKVHENLIK